MENLQFEGKTVLVRVDFNVPLDGSRITDDTRMRKSLPTIEAIASKGGAVVLFSHLGRPQKQRLPDGSIDVEKFTLRTLRNHLAELTRRNVIFSADCVGDVASNAVDQLQPGEILLLENTRFHAGEEKGDQELAQNMASLGDIYINDAFGTAHREHASTAVIARYFAKDARAFGLLMQQELKNAAHVLHHSTAPLVAILGGAKVSDKIGLLTKLLSLADDVIIGGAMAFTFIRARGGNTGKSLVEEDKLDLAIEILNQAAEQHTHIHLPTDAIAADAFSEQAAIQTVPIHEIPDGWMGLDIGPESIQCFESVIAESRTILWNGPMGVFEMPAFSKGTLAIAQAVALRSRDGAFSLIGGGDSVAAINQSGFADDVSFISTGGGAMLEFLEGKELPGVAAMLAES